MNNSKLQILQSCSTLLETVRVSCSTITVMKAECNNLVASLENTMACIDRTTGEWKATGRGQHCLKKLLTFLQTSQSLMELLERSSNRKMTSVQEDKWKDRFSSVRRQCSDLEELIEVCYLHSPDGLTN